MKKEDIIKLAEPLINEGIKEGQSDYDIAYNIAKIIIDQEKANPVENRVMPKIAEYEKILNELPKDFKIDFDSNFTVAPIMKTNNNGDEYEADDEALLLITIRK